MTTFNCKNIRTCSLIFNELAKSNDIVLIQEHWLFKCQLQLLNELCDQFIASGKSVDFYDPIPPIQIPRGYGGVAIFWKKYIDYIVNDLELGNERIKCIEVCLEKPILIACVYMPCNGEKDSYHAYVECIEQIQELIHTYQNTHDIIIGGDFNENAIVKSNTKRSLCFHQFLTENKLATKDSGHTFIHPNGKDCSAIDYFLYKECNENRMLNIFKGDYIENVSDHHPVTMTLSTQLPDPSKSSVKPCLETVSTNRINWDKVDKQQYARNVSNKLSNLNIIPGSDNLNDVVHTINNVLTESAKDCVPTRKRRQRKPKLKVMNVDIHAALQAKKKAFYQWKQNGRPNDPQNFYLLEKKLKSVELRRQIRIEVARQKNEEKVRILQARQSDTKLFHKLIKKQRGQCQKFIDELQVGQKTFHQENILSGWYEHFKNLATKTNNPDYDLKFLERVEEEVAVIYLICLNVSQDISLVTDQEIKDAIQKLNRGKAPDGYGVSAEHIIHGEQDVLDIIKLLLNQILLVKDVPASMKLGILNPIFKNKGSRKDSKNYRGITITPVLTRLLEAVLKNRIKSTLMCQQNPLQRGFTANSSPMNCALLVEEFYRENKDLHKPTYLAFMDVKSAFDVVVHPNLMRKLYNSGVTGQDWLLINSLHQNSMTSVKWQGELSPAYVNQQGVRQGGVLSADLYKMYNNGAIDRIVDSGKGAFIGDIRIPAPTCADDMTLMSNDSCELQYIINISKDCSELDGYTLQEIKSVIVLMDSIKTYPEDETWFLGSKTMPVVENTLHMGILRSRCNQEIRNVEANIQKAKRAAFSLMGAGLHGENGQDPETALSLLQTYVTPVLFYGLEIITPTGKPLSVLDTQYKKLLKQILSLPNNTADPAVYLLSGVLPAEAVIHKRILTLFGNITRLAESAVEYRLAKRQLEIKTFKSHSWFINVKKILIKYNLPCAEEILDNPPRKLQWKRLYNCAINKYWSEMILSQSRLYSSLKYLSKSYNIGKCHPAIKPYKLSCRDIIRIPVKNKLMTGTFILQSNRAKFNQNEVNPTCQLCYAEDETIQHFLLQCETLETIRKHILDDIKQVISDIIRKYPDAGRYSLVQLLVDCSIVQLNCPDDVCPIIDSQIDLLHYHSRRLVYTLYSTRYLRLSETTKCTKKRS